MSISTHAAAAPTSRPSAPALSAIESNANSNTDSYVSARIERAAKNSMVVHSFNDSPGMFVVYNVRGEDYIVDVVEKVCDCPDYVNRERTCKHIYRAEMHLGLREIPAEFGRCDARLMREIALRKKAAAREDDDHPLGVSRAEQAAIENSSEAAVPDGGRVVTE